MVEWASIIQIRDGVVIDRDSHTAVDGLKYDYEVVPAGAVFKVIIEVDNPTDQDLALLGAALFDWSCGNSLGGFTSRGLGRFHLRSIEVGEIDLTVPEHRVRFLTATKPEDRFVAVPDWKDYFQARINRRLQSSGGNS